MNMQRVGLVALAGAMVLLSACSSKSTTTTSPTPTPTPTAAATSPSSSASSSALPTSAATATASATASASATAGAAPVVVVHTSVVTVAGKSENVLTNAQGFTLYYHTTDTPTSVCSGACATAWPPVLLPSGTPGSSLSLPGTLGVETNANGRQVTYNGHPLYGWKSDTSPGQATGEGINSFHVVTVTIAGM
jgi:predicted lipoprotein with Yx(FWY)xxD motif